MNQEILKQTPEEIGAWSKQLFKIIDTKDVNAFTDYFSEEAKFVFGSFPEANGKKAIREFVGYFLDSVKTISHELVRINVAGDILFVNFEVTYQLENDKKVTIPGIETLIFDGTLVKEYIIYLDPTPLFALQSET
jgi:ketosteroid isomerase-like protein